MAICWVGINQRCTATRTNVSTGYPPWPTGFLPLSQEESIEGRTFWTAEVDLKKGNEVE